MAFKIKQREVGDITIFTAPQLIALGREGDPGLLLQYTLCSYVDLGRKKIILDLSKTDFMDSAALGNIVKVYNRAQKSNVSLKLISVTNSRVWDFLQITKMYTVFEIFPDEQSAITSFTSAVASTTK